jgi:DNA polymerase-4
MKTNTITHIDMDTFFVSCERLINPALAKKPVLVGGTSDRGVVASCSYEARKFGVHAAMPMRLAKTLCPDAAIIQGDSSLYSKLSDVITEIIREKAPLYEKSSIDEFYIDLSGMDRFHGCYQWSHEIRQDIIKETGLPISFGLSSNKTVAKVATGEAKPNGKLQISHGAEKTFLAPLSVRKIPMVGPKNYEKLRSLGAKHISTIQQFPVEIMERVFGKYGIALWKKAQGIDETPIIPYREKKSISVERTFERDTADKTKLNSILTAMTESLAFQLRNANKLTACINIKIRYADLNTYSKQATIPYSSSDHILVEKAKELFTSLYDRRLLIRLIGIRFSHLVGGGQQIRLFEDSEEMINLYSAMDKIRKKFGQTAVKHAIAMESSNMSNENPFNGEPPVIPAHRRI